VTQKQEKHSLSARVGLHLYPHPQMIETLVQVEEAGLDQVWISSGPAFNSDLLTTLAVAAGCTSHLKFGTYILHAPARHPVFLAQQALSFQAVAPDRLLLGVGTGSPALAKQLYGREVTPQLAYLREYVQVLRQVLHQGEVHHQGRFFTTDARLPASAQIPVLISALGPQAFRVAGEVADGALPYACPIPYLLNTALPAMNEGAAATSRPRPPLVAQVSVAFTEDRATALEAGRQALSFAARDYRNMFLGAGFSDWEIDTVADSFVEKLMIFGSESKIKDYLQELLATEIDELAVSLVGFSDPEQEPVRLARLISQI
jgi:alkanesulfonate monooxygenase SsuD/methylene tetrahydromethanopterin reductase-like flavin-dependent oxidoreductase (luciferase family)